MKMTSKNLIVTTLLLSLLGSCGKSDSGSGVGGSPQAMEDEEIDSTDGSTIDGTYQAIFQTMNPHVNGTIPGSLTLFREGDKLMTFVRLFAGGAKTWHQQGIYMGNRCPTIADDTNGDGFVDIEEGMRVFGQMIIPLDANMNSQSAGRNFYPVADLSGYYHYERVSSFQRLFDDLYTEDRDLTDNITKLKTGEAFGFLDRVIVIQGVAEATVLPDTIAITGRRRPFQTLPIVCGVIKKVTQAPGRSDDGVIPGPVAPVIDGQDQPAPPEDETSAGSQGGTVSGTIGTNDSGNDGEVTDENGNPMPPNGETTGGVPGNTTGGTPGGATTGETSGGRTAGGFIGGFIGGRDGGSSTGGSTGGSTTGETGGGSTGDAPSNGRTGGGFIGGFIGGRNQGQ